MMYEIAHVGIVVNDADRSSQFYEKALGCKVTDCVETDMLKLVFLQAGKHIIELVEHRQTNSAQQRGAGVGDHIAFNVADIDQALENLKPFHVKLLLDSPKILPDKKIMFFSGPDGERLEFIQML